MLKRKLRVLFVSHSAQLGGAEYCLEVLLKSLDRSLFDAEVIFACEGPMTQLTASLGFPTGVRPLSWWMGFEPSAWYWRNLALAPWRLVGLVKKIRNQHFDVVYTNSAVIFEGALAAHWAKAPHVWHVHEIVTPHYWNALIPLRRICRYITRWSDHVIFESQAAKHLFLGNIKPLPYNLYPCFHVIPNPLRLSHDSVEEINRERARQSLVIGSTDFVVIWIGQLIPRKNPGLILQAFEKAQFPCRATLVMLGDGPLRWQIESYITRAQSGNKRIMWKGFQKDVSKYLQAADVLVLTSREESFGMVLLEAGAFGLPVVATACGGPEEIILDGVTGYIIPVEDYEALAKALVILSQDASLRNQMGRAAYERVCTQYTPQRYVVAVEHILKLAARGLHRKDEKTASECDYSSTQR